MLPDGKGFLMIAFKISELQDQNLWQTHKQKKIPT